MTAMKRTADYVPPDERPATLPVRMDGPISLGVEPDLARTGCPWCNHVAWRVGPGSPDFECACPPSPRSCHYPIAKRFAKFPADLPPEAA